MSKNSLLLIFFSFFTLYGCDSESDKSEELGESLQFTTIYKTPARDIDGTTLAGVGKTFRVFNTQTEFNTFVQRYPFFIELLNQSSTLPSLADFEAGLVIMTFLGEKSSTGYDIEITNVNMTANGYAVVSILSEMAGDGCAVGDALTYPMHLVYLPSRIEFVFEEQMTVYTC